MFTTRKRKLYEEGLGKTLTTNKCANYKNSCIKGWKRPRWWPKCRLWHHKEMLGANRQWQGPLHQQLSNIRSPLTQQPFHHSLRPWTLRPCLLALKEYRLGQQRLHRLHPHPSLCSREYNYQYSNPYAPCSPTVIVYIVNMVGGQVHQ